MDQTIINTKTMYDEYRFGHFSYGAKRDKYDSLLFKFISMVEKDKKLFDIGCGTGYWLDKYVKSGIPKKQITGIDFAPSNISELTKKGFNTLCGNVLELEIEDNVSDFTVCNGVIHHTTNPFKAFKELVRITKPGSYIYLNVYNKWNPYFYIVHRATYPLRYIYWNFSKKIIDYIFPLSKILYQPLAYLALGEFLDDKTGKAFFMDQIITPQAHLFSKPVLRSYASRCNCSIVEFKYNRYFLMLAAIIKVNK